MKSLNLLKETIKSKSSEQTFLKLQRKKLPKEEIVYHPRAAQSKFALNRNYIKCLYIAYDQLRGKLNNTKLHHFEYMWVKSIIRKYLDSDNKYRDFLIHKYKL